MKNIDRKMSICQVTGISPENYDKIINYLSDNGIDVSFPEKIGKYDSLVTTGNIVGFFNTYDKENVDGLVPSNAEIALAEQIGVDAKDILKLGSYFETFETTINNTNWTVPISSQEVGEFLNSGVLSTFSDGRLSAEKICNEIDIEYSKDALTNTHYATNVYEDYGYKVIDQDNALMFYKDNEIFVSIIIEDDAQRKEFVSEFKEMMDGVNGNIDINGVNNCIDRIRSEIESENRFITDEKKEELEKLREKAESLENRLDNLQEKLENNPNSNSLERLTASVQSQLENVEKQINSIEAEELANAEGYKAKIEDIKNGIVEDIMICGKALSTLQDENLISTVREELSILYGELDEANDKINACDRVIERANSVEQVTEAVTNANEISQEFQAQVADSGNVISSEGSEAIAATEDVESKAKDFWIKLDNWFGDLKDLATDFANQFASDAASATAASTSDAYAQFDSDIKDFVMGVVEFCKDVKELISEIVEDYQDIKTSALEIVQNAAEEITDYAKDKIDALANDNVRDDDAVIEAE